MEIKNYTIKDQADVFAFFLYLQRDLGLNFHPDTPFANYVDREGKQVFTKEQCIELDVMLYNCFYACDIAANDIYWLAGLSAHFLTMYTALHDAQLPICDPDTILELIENTYFV